jgi:2-iminobutanoate/2-iminopropanoate deaminase
METIMKKHFSEDPPARTFVNVGSWPHPFDIEVECVAVV